MMRRIVAGVLGVLFASAFLFNVYLLFSVVDGAHVVREAEAAAGHALSCFELYETHSIDAYFYPDRALQGTVIYVSSVLCPLWLIVSIGLPLALTAVLGIRKRWHWLPPILMAPPMLITMLYLNMIGKIVCAIE